MIIYLCNAIDEDTKKRRVITTDSPAATKKVFGLCQALKTAETSPVVVSMGRGRQNGSCKWFSSFHKSNKGVVTYYASFWHMRFITHVVTAISLMFILAKLLHKETTLIAYNRSWHYVPALCFARLRGGRCFLDLEDGWLEQPTLSQRLVTVFYDWACHTGSILACDALKIQVKTKNNYTCYGAVASLQKNKKVWGQGKIKVLFGGSLCSGTGVDLFIQGIRIFMKRYPELCDQLEATVVGFGIMSKSIEAFAAEELKGLVSFKGEVSADEYQFLLRESHVGLSLKLTKGVFNDSTFPSKVIELTAHGLLLISTDVSDVPKIFSSGHVLFIQNDDPNMLAEHLCWAVTKRKNAEALALQGQALISDVMSGKKIGSALRQFLFEGEIR